MTTRSLVAILSATSLFAVLSFVAPSAASAARVAPARGAKVTPVRNQTFSTPLAAAKKAGGTIFHAQAGDLGLKPSLKLRYQLLTTEKKAGLTIKEYAVETAKQLGKAGGPAGQFNVVVRRGADGKWKWNGRFGALSNDFTAD